MPNTANTYSLIQTITLASTGSATFTNIPDKYTDLKLIVNARSTTPNDQFALKFNGADYVAQWCRLSGADAATLFVETDAASTSGSFIYGGVSFLSQTGFWGCSDVYIPNYTSTSPKPVGGYGANKSTTPGSQSMSYSGGHTNTGAITQIEVLSTGGAIFQTNSVFSLYGIIKY